MITFAREMRWLVAVVGKNRRIDDDMLIPEAYEIMLASVKAGDAPTLLEYWRALLEHNGVMLQDPFGPSKPAAPPQGVYTEPTRRTFGEITDPAKFKEDLANMGLIGKG